MEQLIVTPIDKTGFLILPFTVASLASGLLLSTLVQSQAQAMQLGFLFLMPNLLISGFMFPREAMPDAAQWIGAALPLTHFLPSSGACCSGASAWRSSGRRG